jgi:glutamyl-tRNA reductase
MLSNYTIITLTHRHIPLRDLGDFVMSASEENPLSEKLMAIKKALGIDELLYLATCNRILFFVSKKGNVPENFAAQLFRLSNPGLGEDQIKLATDHLLELNGLHAIRHLFEVASSIDSLVVGEREILRQLREAYAQCSEWNLTGDDIRLAMRYIVEAAKAVYDLTRIGEKPVSVVSLAFQQMKKEHLSPNARILMIGAGQTNNLVAKFLTKYGFKNVTVFNRTEAKAAALAKRFDGQAFPLTALENYKAGFDVMVVCTGAVEPVVDVLLFESLLAGEKEHKVIVDLGIPNNVATAVTEQFNCRYIGVDSLHELATQNRRFRKKEVSKAKVILEEKLLEFQSVYRERQNEKIFQHIPAEIKSIKEHALNVVFRKDMEQLDEETKALFERMLNYMERRCISVPMIAVKNLSD